MTSNIAVVISTYNNPNFLRLVLDGYRQQSDQHFKIYIADDGSTEETRELIAQYSKTFPVPIEHLWHEDQGFRKARIHNIALQHISEPYTILTDGDCIPLANMIATHHRLAQPKTLISGSRILLSPNWTKQLCTAGKTPTNHVFSWFKHNAKGNINRVMPLLMPAHLSAANQKLSGIHGCHLSCHTADLMHINGFDESFEGWGREDSDLVARLFHSGIKRRNLRGTPVLHLWHQENTRQHLEENNQRLAACLHQKTIQAAKGIQQLEAGNHHA